MFDFAKAAEACDRAAAAGTLQEEMASVFEVLKYREEIQIALTNQVLAKCAGPLPKHERLPLRDETGQDYGEVVARVPKALFFGLRNQKNFGDAGFESEDGLRDLLKAFPAARTKTVSGKVTVGWRGHPNSASAIFAKSSASSALKPSQILTQRTQRFTQRNAEGRRRRFHFGHGTFQPAI